MADPERSVAEWRRRPRTTAVRSGEPVRLWLLGAFGVSVGHRVIGEKEWRLKKAGSLLKLLALAPGHRLHRERALAASEGGVERAARLWGAAEALLERIEATAYAHAPDCSLYESQVRAARAELDEAAWQAAWAQGRAMTTERAIEYALLEREEPPTLVAGQRPPPDERAERLTSRELEVAVLVARGLTNRKIASELSVSERTVANHVGKILKKLGFSSRALIAAWIARR